MICFEWHAFSDLTVEQLYAVLALRAQVFILEQKILYVDPDGKDQEALHLLGMEENKLVAYARLFPPHEPQNYIKFGRVLTSNAVRTKGYGKQLIRELLNYCGMHFKNVSIHCSAQFYLKNFYESFGFESYGDQYDEEGIPHIAMKKITL